MRRSDYTYELVNNVICITDLDFGNMSVTNDIENVIEEIDNELRIDNLSIMEYKIIYCDSNKYWDGVLFKKLRTGYHVDFYPIHTKKIDEALQHVNLKM